MPCYNNALPSLLSTELSEVLMSVVRNHQIIISAKICTDVLSPAVQQNLIYVYVLPQKQA